MKPLNSQNLLIASLLGLSTLFAGSNLLVKAQSEPKLGCQATVDKVIQEIRAKGVRRVEFSVSKGNANEGRTGNPTNRTDVLAIVIGNIPKYNTNEESIVRAIYRSSKLMNIWANKIAKNCNNTAIITFPFYFEEFFDYFIQSDGTTKIGKCVEPENRPNPLPSGIMVCMWTPYP